MNDKKYDCSWCHSFTRPERNLQRPGTTEKTPSGCGEDDEDDEEEDEDEDDDD